MLSLRYLNEKKSYLVSFKTVSKNIVQITGEFPVKESGFVLSREGKSDEWDYSAYTTVYREIDGGVQFSNDGSVYVEPEPPEPYIPTLEEVKAQKVSEINSVQQATIQNGIDVTLLDGTVEHFTLTDHDQTSLMGLQTQVAQGVEQIPWHTADQSEHCKYYSNMDMYLIVTEAMKFVTFHVTWFRDLRIYINSLETKEEVEAVTYDTPIPKEYQSEVLKDLLAAMV